MKIWKIESALGEYESFQLVNKDREFLREFKKRILCGKNQKEELVNLEVEVVEGTQRSDSPKFWSASGTLIFSKRAKECVEEFLGNCVEFIPIKYKDSFFYLVNILEVIDAINYEKVILRKLDTGLVVGIEEYSFIADKVQRTPMFKVLLNGRIYSTEIYVSDKLKKKIEADNLIGFKFIEVWDSTV